MSASIFGMTKFARNLHRALYVLPLIATALALALHFVHLTADFPNYSPWMDWAKYTDEGWYGDAAIRHFQLGHWYIPGDFNPAAALPVWPAVEGLVFTFTQVTLTAARALTVCVFSAILVCSWLLIVRHSPLRYRSLAAPSAVLLLAASPFCFVFTRLAITEPLLILLTLLALLAAAPSATAAPPIGTTLVFRLRANLPPVLALGLLLPLMVLTKTTALFLTPCIFWMLFASTGYRVRAFLHVAIPTALLAGGLWLLYFLAVVRPHYLMDYRYLFSANAYTGMTHDNFAAVISATLRDGRWIGPVLYPSALVSAAVALFHFRRLLLYPLIPALLLWSAGYATFLSYHNNLQPRYYLVVAIPLTLLLPVVVEDLILPRLRRSLLRNLAFAVLAVLFAAIVLPDAAQTIRFVRQPEYTLVHAAEGVAAYISQDRRTDPSHNPLILSISGSDISLMTGLPSICDDFGTLELPDRVKRYRPGWYVAWNQVEDDKMDAMTPLFQLQRVASFAAMDDPDRNLLILYKLVPAGSLLTHPARRPTTPRRLRTRVGQQPSSNQLQH